MSRVRSENRTQDLRGGACSDDYIRNQISRTEFIEGFLLSSISNRPVTLPCLQHFLQPIKLEPSVRQRTTSETTGQNDSNGGNSKNKNFSSYIILCIMNGYKCVTYTKPRPKCAKQSVLE